VNLVKTVASVQVVVAATYGVSGLGVDVALDVVLPGTTVNPVISETAVEEVVAG
jgi:hypothetical protein